MNHQRVSLHSLKWLSSASIVALHAGLFALSAHAQEAPRETTDAAGAEQDSSGDIIVTARRVEENIQDVPVAVTAFNGDGLRARQIETAADLQYNVPSLSITPAVGGNSANYGLRGQRQGIGNAQGVVTYLAEIPVSASSTYRQTFDMASIQVLKGPQGTLFGANSNGGAVLFGPRKPTDEFEGEVRVAVGSYSLREITAVLNVPIAEWVKLRVAGNFVRRDGYTENLNTCPRVFVPSALLSDGTPGNMMISPSCGRTGAQDDDRHDSWRASLSLSPTENLQNDFVYWGIREDNIGSSWVPFRFGGPLTGVVFANPIAGLLGIPTAASVLADQNARGPRKVMTDEQSHIFNEDGISNITSLDLGDVTIKNIYGYRSYIETQNRDQDGSILPYVQQDGYQPGRARTHTNELQLLGSLFDDRLKFVTGAYINRTHTPGLKFIASLYQFTPAQIATLQAIGAGALVFPNPVTGRQPSVDSKTKTDALFVNIDINIAEGLRFSGGYRYTWNKVDTRAPQNLVNGVCTDVPTRNYIVDLATCTRVSEQKDNGSNYSATIQYDIVEDTMVYIATRHGFKPGGVNDVAVVDPNYFFYKPETITDYEIGLKSQFEIGAVKVRANIAAYTSTYKDVQRSEIVQQASGVPASTTFNAQKATIRGIEPEINIQFGHRVNLSAFYAYLDAKFDKYEVPGPGNTVIDKSGTQFSAVSKHSFGATLSYKVPLPERFGELTATGNYYYRSSQTFADNNLNQPSDLIVPSYGIFNARLDWESADTGLTISAAVSNLFNKTYVVGGADYTASVVGYAINAYGPPRMFRLEAGIKF